MTNPDPAKELERYKRGDLTDAEFQELCHNLHESGRPMGVRQFCDGCEDYQIKLFGFSPIRDLKERVRVLHSKLGDALVYLGCDPCHITEVLAEPVPAIEKMRPWKLEAGSVPLGDTGEREDYLALKDENDETLVLWYAPTKRDEETANLIMTVIREYTDLLQAVAYNRHMASDYGHELLKLRDKP